MQKVHEKDEGLLHGLQVLDLTEHMAGPFCTMILADMGAEIVKLERPGRGDAVRAWGDGSERNPYFRYINRNKKGIALDYKQPEGKALFLRLLATLDVLVANNPPPGGRGLRLSGQGRGGNHARARGAGRAADLGRPADLRSRHRDVGGSGHPRGALRTPADGGRMARLTLAAGERD